MDGPDASAGSGLSQVTVYMGSSVFIDHEPPWPQDPSPCQNDVVSVDGQSVTVTATTRTQHRAGQHCVGNTNCCPRSGLEWLGSRAFFPTEVTLPFTQTPFTPTVDASVDSATDISPIDVGGGSE